MYYLLLTIISIIIFYLVSKISKKFNLLDYPDNRKIHNEPTPYVGGFAISILYLIIIYFSNFVSEFYNNILVYGFVISLFGLIDDKYKIGIGSKLVLQLMPIIFMIHSANIYLENLGEYELIGFVELGSFSLVFSILCIFLLINSINYIDGLDGLASIVFLSSCLSFLFFSHFEYKELNLFIFSLIIPVIIFLFFNFNLFYLPKLFLGNSGSNLLGFLLSFISIFVYKKYNIHPALIVWSLAFPVYEFLSTNILRIWSNREIFKPGHDHLHYEINQKIKNKYLTNIIILLIIIFYSCFGYFIFSFFNSLTSIITFIISFFIYFFLRKMLTVNKVIFTKE